MRKLKTLWDNLQPSEREIVGLLAVCVPIILIVGYIIIREVRWNGF